MIRSSFTVCQQLMDHLWNEYCDTKKEEAMDQYDNLAMRPTDSYQAFKNNFVRLAGFTNKPKTTWKTEFKRKLTTYLRNALARDYRDPTCVVARTGKYQKHSTKSCFSLILE